MSESLMGLAHAFLRHECEPELFVDNFIAQWKQERDSGESSADSPQLSEILSSIFCLADMFNAEPDREEYELDEPRLRSEIEKLLQNS